MAQVISAPGAVRFRAYARALGTHKPSFTEIVAANAKGESVPARVRHHVEEVVAEGDVVDGRVAFTSDKVVTRVVLYAGPVEEEVVVGSVAVDTKDVEIEVRA
jgi:hypothetical protein